MFRPASRTLLARSIPSRLPRAAQARRFLSTAPPSQRSRGWKSSAARWGIAAAGIYWYNTSNVFAEEPAFGLSTKPDPDDDSTAFPTVDSSLALSRRAREAREARHRSALASIVADDPLHPGHGEDRMDMIEGEHMGVGGGAASPEELEEEASQEGAFNPETGEINWDCPCLGGMAHGPCGEEFKAAFSCFVFSTEEPKGMDCIDRFKGMQDCFRLHPDIYGSELEEDEIEDALDKTENPGTSSSDPIDAVADHPVPPPASTASPEQGTSSIPPSNPLGASAPPPSSTEPHPPASEDAEIAERTTEKAETKDKLLEKKEKVLEKATAKVTKKEISQTTLPVDESKALVPRAAHDARDR